MQYSPKIIAATVAGLLIPVGVGPALAADDPPDDGDRAAEVLSADPATPEVDGPDDSLIVFSADARIDGQRVDDELYLALGYDEHFPFFASVWLLVDPAADDWVPICFGFLQGDEDGAVFVGGSTVGDEDDGCLVVPLGDEDDDSGVAFGVVELEGDHVATAAMYAIG